MSVQNDAVAEIKNALRQALISDPQNLLTMPPAFYHSSEFLKIEEEHVFRREWVCLGQTDQLPRAGDYFATELVGEPLLVVRGSDGNIRVLSNVCRHRGTLIASEAGNARRLVCPYHGWTYSHEGQLLHAPYMERVVGFDVGTWRLPEFACEVWQGFIYVNLDGSAASLAPRLHQLDGLISNYHIENYRYLDGDEGIWEANWKCLIENFMEGYHLSFSHAHTLGRFSPTRLCEKLKDGVGFTVYRTNQPERAETPYAHADTTDKERHSSLLILVYPSHLIALSTHSMLSRCVRPVDADNLAVRWALKQPNTAETSEESKARKDFFMRVVQEDRAIIEGIQRGMKSRFVQRAPIGPKDLVGSIVDFNLYLARMIIET
jgi:phenylpropionate dioxygenase-like ring-hydroxylating dioxygenase large terminal subunit